MQCHLTREIREVTIAQSFGGQTETVTLLKRNDDQQEGTVTSYLVFRARHSKFEKTEEPLAGSMTATYKTIWHLPRVELDRIGIGYLNSADRIVDLRGWQWQPESTTVIVESLFMNEIDVYCLRVR